MGQQSPGVPGCRQGRPTCGPEETWARSAWSGRGAERRGAGSPGSWSEPPPGGPCAFGGGLAGAWPRAGDPAGEWWRTGDPAIDVSVFKLCYSGGGGGDIGSFGKPGFPSIRRLV
jgi:hypothetical protein